MTLRNNLRKLVVQAGAMLALATVAASSANAQVQVRFGSVGGLTDAGVYLAEEFGFFKEAGITIAAKRMASAPTLVTSLATDQLDVAGIEEEHLRAQFAQRSRPVSSRRSIRKARCVSLATSRVSARGSPRRASSCGRDSPRLPGRKP